MWPWSSRVSAAMWLRRRRQAAALLALVLFCLQLIGGQAVPASAAAKTVHVALKAKWQGTSLLLEAGEFVSDVSNDQYWHFISSWHQHVSNSSTDGGSDAACVAAIADIAEDTLTPRLRQVLPVALVLRSYSPRVATFRQLAEHSLRAAGKEYASPGGGERQSAGQQPVYHEPVILPHAPCCWIDVDGQIAETASSLSDQLGVIQRGKASGGNIELYEFDHVYPSASFKANHTAVLYATPGAHCFDELHKLLVAAAAKGVATYVHRPVYLANCNNGKHNVHCASAGTAGVLQLGGYGGELAIKNMEYKAIDDSNAKKDSVAQELESEVADADIKGFLFKTLLERKPEKAAELLTFRDILLSSADMEDTLKVWDLKDLGVQAAQRIVAASDPLKLLRDISHNFPSLVSSLSRLQANSTLKAEITANQNYIQVGATYLSINGFGVDIQTLDPFILFKLLREEIALSDQLAALKLSPETIRQLLRLLESKAASSSIRIDARSPVHVHFANDLENDAQYQMFSPSLREMLMPVYPGQMRYVRKNLFTGVFVIDPVSPSGLEVIRAIKLYIDKLVPVRMGIMLAPSPVVSALPAGANAVSESAAGHQVASVVSRMFDFFRLRSGTAAAFRFLFKLAELSEDMSDMDGDSVSTDMAVAAFEATYRKLKAKAQKETMDEAIAAVLIKGRHAEDVAASVQFISARGLANVVPCLLLNGMLYTNDNVPQMLLHAVNEETPFVQESIYYGQIDPSTDVLDFALKTGSYKRYNPLILPQRGDAQPSQVPLAATYADRSSAIAQLSYLHHPGTEDDVKPITHWLVADLSSGSSIRLAQEAVKRLASDDCKLARFAFVHNPADWQPSQPLPPATRFVAAALHMTSRRHKLVPFLQSLLPRLPELTVAILLDLATEVGLHTEQLRSLLEDQQQEELAAEVRSHQKLCQQLLHLQPGQNAVVTNGRVFTPISTGSFLAEDFELLDGVEYSTRASLVQPVVEKSSFDVDADLLTSEFFSDLISASISVTMGRARGQLEPKAFNKFATKHSAIMVKSPTAVVDVRAIINPLSPTAQKLAPMLIFLREAFGDLLAFAIHLNPEVALSDMPLKSYYRYALDSQMTYTEQGSLTSGPAAIFGNLATNKVLTLHMHVPEHWLVEGTYAQYDMDNLRLSDMGDEKSTYVQYELEALLVTGSCRDVSSREPPRGLQLLLGTDTEQHVVDTIVMSNLGYFQLKAAPGVWYLRLAPGQSSEIYAILASQDSSVNNQDVVEEWTVSVIDFGGRLVPLFVTKRPGKETEDVLDASESASDSRQSSSQVAATPAGAPAKSHNLWKYAQQYLHGLLGSAHVLKHEASAAAQPDGIHIFSVASGHLYERFLKIMILSVLNNTKSPVTFWFIKNYLSPQFKDFIPHMARRYDFQYRLVTYKWPTWLMKQTEKQRIIWAYKILFLDVLFPLSLNKVIYVDADQIVRTDMQDLWDMDLHGSPLAYTPFCDNNKEMEGFRFWKQGFWKDHLRGRPYHISALYVVDLQRFRQTAAGDHLRVYYNNLAKDPNSLANLDQDLPNYAQHVVPIFSLPQEWLWCESWCGNATKAAAKTIDLCNNPLTKEPKLEGARRIVAEWPALDAEVRRFTEAVEAQGEIAAEGSDIAQPPLSAAVGGSDLDDLSDRTEL